MFAEKNSRPLSMELYSMEYFQNNLYIIRQILLNDLPLN